MMLKNGLQASYKVIEPNQYLVITMPENEVIEYCLQMGERNHIPGLLDVHRQMINGELALYYNISDRQLLTSWARGKKLGQTHGEHVFRSLIECFTQLPEYFLHSGMCLLDAEYLFVDKHLNTYLPLVPATSAQQGGDEMKSFFLSVFGKCFREIQNEPYFDRILKYLIGDDFSLKGLADLAIPQKQEAFSAPQPIREVPPADWEPDPVVRRETGGEQQKPVKEKPAKGKDKAPEKQNFGFSIPGMEEAGGEAPEESQSGSGKQNVGFLGKIFSGKKGEGKTKEDKLPPAPSKEQKQSGINMNVESHTVSQIGGAQSGRAAGEWVGTAFFGGYDEGTSMMDQSGPALIHQGRRIALAAVPMTIGREGCSYNIPNRKVSQTHATIYREGEQWFVRDEGSLNHTYVNGALIPPYTPTPLENGAVIRMANEELRLETGAAQ